MNRSTVLLVAVLAAAGIVAAVLLSLGDGPSAVAPLPPEERPAPPVEPRPSEEPAPLEAEVESEREGSAEPAPAPRRPPPVQEPFSTIPSIIGVITDGDGQPLRGALVEARGEAGSVQVPMTETTSRRDGTYLIALEGLAFERRLSRGHYERLAQIERRIDQTEDEARRQAERAAGKFLEEEWDTRPPRALVLVVQIAGYQIQTKRLRFPFPPPYPRKVDFAMSPGATVLGVVRDAAGPVAGAQVNLLSTTLESLSNTETDLGGRFYLGVRTGGVYVVHARHPSHGTSSIEDLQLAATVNLDVGELWLNGDGDFAGRVVDPDRRPVPGVTVEAVPESFAFQDRPSIPFSDLVAAEIENGGLFHGSATTNAIGEFEISGLATGRFAMRLPELRNSVNQPTELYETSKSGIQLVFYEHRLYVNVRDERYRNTPEGATVSIARLVKRDGKSVAVEEQRKRADGGPDALFFVKPDERYLVRAWAPDHYEDADVARIEPIHFETRMSMLCPAEGSELARDLDPRQASEGGALYVHVRTAGGQSIPHFLVRLVRRPEGRLVRGYAGAPVRDDGFVGTLSPGAYGVTIVPYDDSLPLTREVAYAEDVLTELGETTRVEVTVDDPGELEIVLGETASTDLRDEDAPDYRDEEVRRKALTERGYRAQLEIGERHIPLTLTARTDADVTDGKRLLPGSRALAAPAVQPGTYWLRMRSPAGRAHDALVEVQVRPGETTRVPVPLD